MKLPSMQQGSRHASGREEEVSTMSETERAGITRRSLVARASVAAGALAVGALRTAPADAAAWPPASAYGAEVPAAWFELALDLIRATPRYSPPVASRALGYTGVVLYEALVPGLSFSRTLAGRLNGLTRFPPPADVAYHWPTVANSALASTLRALFPIASAASLKAIDTLEQQYSTMGRAVLPLGIYRRSLERGEEVALHIFEWSRNDGGHEGFRNNFPPYTPPSGPGLWEPTPPGFLPALQPFWGSNRPFILPSGAACPPRPPLPYAEDPGSSFFAEGHECYVATTHLTPEQEAIARFWSDDPAQTATPPGHSLSILTQVVRRLDLSLDRAAEAYAKVGIAVADAFIACWHAKYEYNLLRPVTYIRAQIDSSWMPLLVTPPFPEYTSGHSVQSAAAAEVLTDLFGDGYAFVDHTHDSRGLSPRSFGSFFEAAEEAALSRLYGGIHFRAAIVNGLAQGRCIGKAVTALPLTS
jgi:PAP2 superfamily